MRVAQTSFIVFISKLLGSVLGFVATLTFARLLGADVIGYYAVIMAVVSWLMLGGDLGISHSISKRVSEATDPNQYFTAGLLTIAGFAAIITVAAVVFRDAIDAYVGVTAWYFVVPLVLAGLLTSVTTSTLNGEQKVHISGLLSPVNLTVSSLIQIGLVLAGFDLTGMIIGYFVGEFLMGLAAITFLSASIRRPSRRHFKRIYDFAKYSWLGSLKLQSFNNVDILVLGAIVSPSLVGVYSVAWSLSKFLTLFGHAVRTTIFPEISNADAGDGTSRIEQLTTDSLSFIGIIAIPGFFGGVVLADRLLQIYGDEFTQGAVVLAVLILSTLIYTYQQQMLAIIKGMDRPEIAFRINLAFIGANLVLNVILVLWIGWLGAAIATAISAFVGLVLAYRALRELVDFTVPIREPARQVAAAVLMAGVVYSTRQLIEASNLPQHNIALVLLLVVLGASIYFLTLLVISTPFRRKVSSNSPLPLPF